MAPEPSPSTVTPRAGCCLRLKGVSKRFSSRAQAALRGTLPVLVATSSLPRSLRPEASFRANATPSALARFQDSAVALAGSARMSAELPLTPALSPSDGERESGLVSARTDIKASSRKRMGCAGKGFVADQERVQGSAKATVWAWEWTRWNFVWPTGFLNRANSLPGSRSFALTASLKALV